jgi:PPK2 family polyphosphate:nucleotide phosphotransferase
MAGSGRRPFDPFDEAQGAPETRAGARRSVPRDERPPLPAARRRSARHAAPGLGREAAAAEALALGVDALAEYQDRLYAQDRWAVLLVFQAMDAAGKDGAIKHVMSGINPQGCQVFSFKAPTSEDLDHDYMWRCAKALPERGRIGIFNRSYYEETLVVRVHPELLTKQRIPEELVTKRIWKQRFQDIRAFERYLARNGIAVVKFFLHVSKAEQKRRFLERLDRPEKNWKFSAADAHEREHWDEYMEAYEDTIRNTASKHAPWYVVPADNKWFTRLVVRRGARRQAGVARVEVPRSSTTHARRS